MPESDVLDLTDLIKESSAFADALEAEAAARVKPSRPLAADSTRKAPQPKPSPATGSPNQAPPFAGRLQFVTARELSASTPEEPEWIVKGYAARSAVTLLSAKIKTGKTHFTLDMAASSIAGRPFLTCATTKTRVLYLTEEREATFQAALKRVGLYGSDDLTALLRAKAYGVPWPLIMSEVQEKALAVGADLVVCDTLSDWAALGADAENDAGAALEAMRPVQEAAAHGLAVVVLVHERKGGGDTVDAARGSSAIGGAADIILSLHRSPGQGHDNRRELTGVGRFDDTPAKAVIELGENHRYTFLGGSSDVEASDARRQLLAILPTTRDQALAESSLVEALPSSRQTIQRVLKQLGNEGVVSREKGCGDASEKAYGYWQTGGFE